MFKEINATYYHGQHGGTGMKKLSGMQQAYRVIRQRVRVLNITVQKARRVLVNTNVIELNMTKIVAFAININQANRVKAWVVKVIMAGA